MVLRLSDPPARLPRHHHTPAPTAATTEVALPGSKVVASKNALSTACHTHRACVCCERTCGEWIFGAGSRAERWFEARPERTVGAAEGSDLLQGRSPAKNVPSRPPSPAVEKSATASMPFIMDLKRWRPAERAEAVRWGESTASSARSCAHAATREHDRARATHSEATEPSMMVPQRGEDRRNSCTVHGAARVINAPRS